MEWKWLVRQNSQFTAKEVYLNGRDMGWRFTFQKTAFNLEWESAQSTSWQVSLDSFYFLMNQNSSVPSSRSRHPASLQSLWHCKSSTAHSQKMNWCCLTSALSQPNALKEIFPTGLHCWMEVCLPCTAPMAASSLTTFLGMLLLEKRTPHGPTVVICITVWNKCLNGDATL